MHKNPDDDSKRILERATQESGGILSSSMARMGNHLKAKDAAPHDMAELWGKRVGRALALAFLIAVGLFILYLASRDALT